jgi:Enoyl-CoA hydratase/carnithine racemase
MAEVDDSVLYAREGNIGRITLNRPEKRNALNDAMIAGLKSALLKVKGDRDVRALVITGSGKDFCSGADLAALERILQSSVDINTDDANSLMEMFLLIRQCEIPVIAAVRGRALAGGCGLASACDLVLASASARFGYPEVKIGFVPAMVMAFLGRNISEKRAFELITLGEDISAAEAHQIGLVNRVFDDEIFDQEVTTYVERFVKISKSAVSLTKALLYQIEGLAFRDALATGADVNVIARMSDDYRNGISKFLGKK